MLLKHVCFAFSSDPKASILIECFSLSKVFNLWVLWIIRRWSEYLYCSSVNTTWLEKMGHEFPEASYLSSMARTSMVMMQLREKECWLSCFLYVFLYIKYIYMCPYICICSHTHMHPNTLFVLWLCQFNVCIFKTFSWLSIHSRLRSCENCSSLRELFLIGRGQNSAQEFKFQVFSNPFSLII